MAQIGEIVNCVFSQRSHLYVQLPLLPLPALLRNPYSRSIEYVLGDEVSGSATALTDLCGLNYF
jgi:hypothetical protein